MILARLGRMAYINTLPVDWGLVTSPLGSLVSLHRGMPTELNRWLADGRIDVSPVSSVAAADRAGEWLILDALCIGCRGEVGSVILHSDRPVEELNGRTIAVTAASATAARLLEVLLAAHWKVEAELVPQDRPAEARLLIGDAALKTAQAAPEGHVYDLGQAWKDHTGKAFVFGLWCLRRSFAREHPDEAWVIYHLLKASYAMGRAARRDVTAEAAKVTGLTENTLESYFPKLVYIMDHELRLGLDLFLESIGYDPASLETFGEQG
jgi:chorismate dehydratase